MQSVRPANFDSFACLDETARLMRTTDPERGRHILEVAAKLFAQRHYHEVRMDDVARAASVAKGTIYRYFQDKEDLYLGLILTALERLYQEVDSGIAHTADPEEKLLFYVRATVRFFTRYPYFFDLVQRIEGSGIQKKIAPLVESRARFFDLVSRLIVELGTTGKYDATQPFRCALALTGMVRQTLRFLPQPWPDDLPEWIVAQFLGGLAQPKPKGRQKPHRANNAKKQRRRTVAALN